MLVCSVGTKDVVVNKTKFPAHVKAYILKGGHRPKRAKEINQGKVDKDCYGIFHVVSYMKYGIPQPEVMIMVILNSSEFFLFPLDSKIYFLGRRSVCH